MNYQARRSRKQLVISGISKAASLLLIFTLIFSFSLSTTRDAAAQGPCGTSYIVLPGDTVDEIADLCGTSSEAILTINPEITDPDNLYPGQIIRIPEPDIISPTVVAINPACGFPGQEIMVVGSGYPENSDVQLSIGQAGQPTAVIGQVESDQYGRIDTTVDIPDDAQPGTTWIVVSQTQISSAQFISTSNDYYVIERVPDPNSATTYVVQEGDTLRSISVKFNREFVSILQANPQITQPDQLNPGQTIRIPPQESGIAQTGLLPVCGPAETDIQVSGSGFPPFSQIDLSLGQYLVSYELAGAANSSSTGAFQDQLTIPSSAQNMQQWVVVAATSTFPSVLSTSNIFTVTLPNDPRKPELYIVKPGDTLNAIAAEYTRTVASILAVNPQITNPNQLEIGEKIIIPGERETIVISPTSGIPATSIQLLGLGFPPDSPVFLGLAREITEVDDDGNESTVTIVNNLVGVFNTDVNGNLQTGLVIPSSARPGQLWSVIALERNEVNADVIARSNNFTVTAPQPPLQPVISIWPPSGPPGTLISVVGSNYPSMTEIQYSFGEVGLAPYLIRITWTEFNGTFAVDLVIPTTADPGETWILEAGVVGEPGIQAVTPEFSVESP